MINAAGNKEGRGSLHAKGMSNNVGDCFKAARPKNKVTGVFKASFPRIIHLTMGMEAVAAEF
jgi:hypothetical protein